MEQKPLIAHIRNESKAIDPTHAQSRALFEHTLGDLPWSGTYLSLLEEGWEWRKAAFIAWASLPKRKRTPKSKNDFAQTIGLTSAKAIVKWCHQNEAINLRIIRLTQETLLTHAPEIVAALIESASDPNYKHAPDRRVALEMAGMYVPRSKMALSADRGDSGDMADKSEAELARLAGLAEGGGGV